MSFSLISLICEMFVLHKSVVKLYEDDLLKEYQKHFILIEQNTLKVKCISTHRTNPIIVVYHIFSLF